jgi:hypothetical protein
MFLRRGLLPMNDPTAIAKAFERATDRLFSKKRLGLAVATFKVELVLDIDFMLPGLSG